MPVIWKRRNTHERHQVYWSSNSRGDNLDSGNAMTANVQRENLGEAFKRIRAMDSSRGEQLQAFAESARRRSPEFAAAIDRLVERLRENGAGEDAPHPGDPMPPFYLPDESGHMVALDQLLATGPVAVTFHRGHWCPYCRININALRRAHQQVSAEGGQIVAIMPDREQFSSDLKVTGQIPFPILTDMDNGYALSLNLAIWIGAEMQKMMAGRQDLPAYQGNSSWMLPIPATFVVGQDGRVKARFVDPDYRKRMAIEDLLAALRS
jgi:peroxiredoxin